jgi:hypothetical protein
MATRFLVVFMYTSATVFWRVLWCMTDWRIELLACSHYVFFILIVFFCLTWYIPSSHLVAVLPFLHYEKFYFLSDFTV